MGRQKNKTHRDGKAKSPDADRAARPPVVGSCGRAWLLAGMTALFVARPLFPSESAATFGDGLTMVMLWIALAVFWLLGAIGRPKVSIRFGPVDAAVLLLVGWYAVAALWAAEHASARPALNMLWEWVGMGLCFLLARQLIVTAREARAMAVVMVALAVALSGYGLYQYAYEMPNTRAQYEADPDAAMREAELWFPPDSPERELFVNRLYSTEPPATFALTNSLAGYLAPWLVVLVGMGVGCRLGSKRLLGMIVCLIPIALCLLLTKSRSAYVATGAGLVLVWLFCRERTIRVGWKTFTAALVGIAVLVASVVAIGGLDRDVLRQTSKSFGYRLQYWQSTLRMIADHPVVGCGPGNFQDAYTQYKLPEASEEVADPHNFLLDVWATAGTPALLALLAVLGCFEWRMRRGGGWEAASGGLGRCSVEASETSDLKSPIKDVKSEDSEPSFDAWAYVLGGGAVGFLLSIPVVLLSAAPPGAVAVLLGLPLAAAAAALLFGWIHDGRLSRLVPAVGVAVLLVNLLGAGGIGLPSVAGSFWLLLALGLRNERPREFRAQVAWAGLLVVIGLAVACYSTGYRPVLNAQTCLQMAEREPARAAEHLKAAAAADPLAIEPWRRLAALEFAIWQRDQDDAAFRQFQRADGKTLELAPNSAPAWLASGDRYFKAFSTMEQDDAAAGDVIEQAVAAYQRALRLYPNNAAYRVKSAEAYRAADDEQAFRHEAEAALRLDDATPHTDKKLPAEVRDRLVRDLQQAR